MLRLPDSYLRQYRRDEAEAMLHTLITAFPHSAPAEKAAKRLRRLDVAAGSSSESTGGQGESGHVF